MNPFAMPVIAFDTETTGVDVFSDRIVTIAVVISPAPGVESRKSWMIDPGVEIPEGAANVHGITTEIAREQGDSPSHVLAEVRALIMSHLESGYGLLAYNAPFDITLLHEELVRNGLEGLPHDIKPVFDPMVLDKQLDPYRKGGRTLSAVSAHYGVKLEDAHDATADALAALQVFRTLGNAPGSDQLEAGWLHDAQMKWQADQQSSLNSYWTRTGKTDRIRPAGWPYQTKEA